MTEYSTDELRELIGKVPTGAIPAAWWVTTDADQIAAYDRWRADFDAHRDRVDAYAKTLGLDGADDAYMWSDGRSSVLTGFGVPTFMGFWNREHPQYQPIPAGWRIDKKENRLVPSRRTKADRESQANKDFAAMKRVPNVGSYMSGLPAEVSLDDRDWGDPTRLCTCLHGWDAHASDERAYFDVNNPTASGHAGHCTKCRCGKFADRVAWRIRQDEPSSWAVVSPSGQRMWSAPSSAAAHQVAHSMASIDEMMARIARMEARLFGDDPRIRPPARRPPKPAMRSAQSAVAVGIR